MRQYKIAMIDDSKAACANIEALLTEALPIEFISYNDPVEALKDLPSQNINLLLLDIQMPQIDGFELSKKLHLNTKTKNIPIIFLTAVLKEEEFVHKGYELGAVDYLIKPVEKYQIINKIKMYYTLFEKNDQLRVLNKSLQEKVETLDKFKKEFVSLFTHEVKTPLNAILNFSEFITKVIDKKEINEVNKDKISTLSKRIHRAGMTQLEIINNLLKFSQVQVGRLIADKTELNYKELIVPIIEQYEGQFNKEVTYNIPDDFIAFMDPKICTMIFQNLYSNALKYSQSKVHVEVEVRDDSFQLRIEDDGKGISEAQKEKIFELFEQTHEESIQVMEKIGTGIGLHTVKLLLDICEKTIDVEKSQRLGGASFVITGQIERK